MITEEEIDNIMQNCDRINDAIIIKEGNYTNPEIFEISDELTKRGYHSLVMFGSD